MSTQKSALSLAVSRAKTSHVAICPGRTRTLYRRRGRSIAADNALKPCRSSGIDQGLQSQQQTADTCERRRPGTWSSR